MNGTYGIYIAVNNKHCRITFTVFYTFDVACGCHAHYAYTLIDKNGSFCFSTSESIFHDRVQHNMDAGMPYISTFNTQQHFCSYTRCLGFVCTIFTNMAFIFMLFHCCHCFLSHTLTHSLFF